LAEPGPWLPAQLPGRLPVERQDEAPPETFRCALVGGAHAPDGLVRRALGARRKDAPPRAGPSGELVRCAHCGVHLPRGEARTADERDYCSEEHARLGPRRP